MVQRSGPLLSEKEIRMQMNPLWKQLHERFIAMTGGKIDPQPEEFPEAFREFKEGKRALVDQYRRRVTEMSPDSKILE